MQKVKLNFRNKEIEVECDDPVKVQELATKYNERLLEFGDPVRISDVKVALITGLKMEYELEQKQNTPAAPAALGTHDELIETIDHLVMYLESLTDKLNQTN